MLEKVNPNVISIEIPKPKILYIIVLGISFFALFFIILITIYSIGIFIYHILPSYKYEYHDFQQWIYTLVPSTFFLIIILPNILIIYKKISHKMAKIIFYITIISILLSTSLGFISQKIEDSIPCTHSNSCLY